jgi:membrane protein implicated in regulation of membrane protease activity
MSIHGYNPRQIGGKVLSIYIACVVFGGVLILGSIVLGHGDSGDAGGAAGSDVHAGGAAHDGDSGGLVTFLSVRFWSFAVAFFGLGGLVVHLLGGEGARAASPAIAAVVGLSSGYAAARLLARLTNDAVGTIGNSASHVGREGRLLLPVARGQRGKVRVPVVGGHLDLVAESDAEDPLPIGTTVLILEMRGSTAVVERTPGKETA